MTATATKKRTRFDWDTTGFHERLREVRAAHPAMPQRKLAHYLSHPPSAMYEFGHESKAMAFAIDLRDFSLANTSSYEWPTSTAICHRIRLIDKENRLNA